MGILIKALLVLLLVVAAAQILTPIGPAPVTVEQKARNEATYGANNAKVYAESKVKLAKIESANAEREARLARQVAAVSALRRAMKNPASFVLSDAIETQDGTLCVTYRAANSFNAIAPGRVVITPTAVITSDDAITAAWNSRCAGRSGTDQAPVLARLVR